MSASPCCLRLLKYLYLSTYLNKSFSLRLETPEVLVDLGILNLVLIEFIVHIVNLLLQNAVLVLETGDLEGDLNILIERLKFNYCRVSLHLQ
jgi:hypothetical protein